MTLYLTPKKRIRLVVASDISLFFSVIMRLGEMAAFEIFEFFLSEKQNCGMLFECPSPLQQTAMAELSRKS